jgi:RND family efflux transporter MFP subunit
MALTEGSRKVADLKDDLASLRIERERPPAPRRRRALVLGIAAAAAAAVYLLQRAAGHLAAVEVETVRPTVVTAGETRAGAPILTASGYVVPRRKAVVSSKIQGRLADLRVEEGSRVREGEILARLESADFEAQIRVAEAQVHRAEADLAEAVRQAALTERLAREKVASRDALDAALSRVRIAEAALAQARADLSLNEALYRNTLIRAPFTGVVLKKMAEVGESVAPIPPGVNISTASGAIVALADLDTLEVEADVSESNVAKLGPDQPAEATVEAFPDRRYRAVLRQIIPTADRTKATVQVKVTILDKDRDLKPEMTAKVTFVRPGASAPEAAPAVPAITVPQEAVVTRDGRACVFEVADGRARRRAVVTGSPGRSGQVVVLEGLAGSETLVARPPESLRDGDRIRIKG